MERAVQERAKAISLDRAADGGKDRLRALIEEEVARWLEDYKRWLRDFDLADPSMVVERVYRNLAGYGPLDPLLADDDVWETMVNGPEGILVPTFRSEGQLSATRSGTLKAEPAGRRAWLGSSARGVLLIPC